MLAPRARGPSFDPPTNLKDCGTFLYLTFDSIINILVPLIYIERIGAMDVSFDPQASQIDPIGANPGFIKI